MPELSPAILTLILVGLLIVGLALGTPIFAVLGGSAVLFFYLLGGWGTVHLSYLRAWKGIMTFVLAAIPMFIFMGAILERSGIAEALYDAIYKWMGGIRGGLAIGTIGICAVFAACTGITGAACVTMGYIALPAMLKRGYKKDIPLGAVTGGSCLGPLIPPSVPMITMGLFGMTSIGGLFMAGVGTGLTVAAIMAIIIAVRCLLKPELAPALPKEERASWREKFISLKGVVLPVLLVIAVLGSIFTGMATPTEASAVGAFGALICAAINRKLNLQIFRESTIRAFRSTGMLMWLMFGAFGFAGAFGLCGGSKLVTDALLDLPGKWTLIIVVVGALMIVGMFMSTGPLVMITAPILFPLCDVLGFNRFWFGSIIMMAQLIGYISPPFGFNLFYMKGIVPDIDPSITMGDIYKSVIPYIGAFILGIIVTCLFPPIATWLPSQMLRGFK